MATKSSSNSISLVALDIMYFFLLVKDCGRFLLLRALNQSQEEGVVATVVSEILNEAMNTKIDEVFESKIKEELGIRNLSIQEIREEIEKNTRVFAKAI